MSESVLFPLLFQYIDLATQKIALKFFFSILNLRSLTGDRTCAPALEAWSLNYWTAREVPAVGHFHIFFGAISIQGFGLFLI